MWDTCKANISQNESMLLVKSMDGCRTNIGSRNERTKCILCITLLGASSNKSSFRSNALFQKCGNEYMAAHNRIKNTILIVEKTLKKQDNAQNVAMWQWIASRCTLDIKQGRKESSEDNNRNNLHTH